MRHNVFKKNRKMKNIKLFLKKYNNFPVPAKAALWFAVCNFLQRGADFLTTPIFTRLLTPEQYGVYTVYKSWYNVISIFATLNLSAGVFNNGMIKYENDRDRYTSAVLGLSMTTTAILLVIYLCAHNYFNELLGLPSILVIAMFIELFFIPAYSLWSARQRFDYSYKALILCTAVIAILSPIIGVVAVLLSEHKAEARVLSYVGVQVCIGIVLCFVNFYKGKSFCVKKYWRYALWFNIPLIPHYLSLTILGQADRIMIDRMVGRSEAAIYGLAYNISQMMVLITSAINSSFVPYTYKSIKDKNSGNIGKNADMLLLLVSFLVLAVICAGPEIIRLFASPEYYEARWIIPPVALSIFFTYLYTLFANIEFYFEANKFITFASMIGAFVNIVLNYIFIPIFGYIAAGYTTLFCYILFALAHCAFHLRVLKKKSSGTKMYNLKFILIISIVLTAIMFVMLCVYDLIYIRYAVIIIICMIVYVKRNYFIEKINSIRS